jgi:HTH-type transcriptional regulator, sugar sensing transcriptional regulator
MSYSTYIKMIKELGLSEYEAKCYLTLFERKSLTVIEVMNLAGIPRPNAYESMKKLLTKGLCISIPGKIKRYAASDPWLLRERALNVVNNSLEIEIEELEKKKNKLFDRKKIIQDNIDTVIDKLRPLYNNNRSNGNPLNYFEVLKNNSQIHRRFVQLRSEAKIEILAFVKPPFSGATEKEINEQFAPQYEGVRKGLKVRSISELPVNETEKELLFKRIREKFEPEKEQLRVVEELPMKLAIFDEKNVMFTLEDPIQGNPSLTAFVAEHHALAKSLKITFESYWEKAKDYIISNNRKYYFSELGKGKDRRGRKGSG